MSGPAPVVRSTRRLGLLFGLFLALFLAPGVLVLATARAGAAGPRSAAVDGRLPGARDALLRAVAVPANVRNGAELYTERCAACHGANGLGTPLSLGYGVAGLGPAWWDFMLSTGRMPAAQPAPVVPRARSKFDARQIADLIAYLQTLPPGGGIPIPAVDPRAGDLSLGAKVYVANCAACHGATGNGGAVATMVAPGVHRATPRQIAEAVRIGPTTMPAFDAQTITRHELDSLVLYLQYLRDPADRGGSGLNHAGPIIEGFVAVFIGLGAVMLVTRFIGTRA